MWNEFKNFIARGNVLDLAVGVVMGSAFTNIVNSLVETIIMPIVTALTGNSEIETMSFSIGAATFNYGLFIQAIIDFLIIAFVLFLIVQAANKFMKKEEAKEEAVPDAEDYLKEIRDLLVEEKQK